MSAMTRIFRDREPASDKIPVGSSPAAVPVTEADDKARAAALAVAVALAEQAQSTARPLTPSQPAIIGAWQLGMRTRQMTQKGEMKRRGKE
jgi:hypothetical protein